MARKDKDLSAFVRCVCDTVNKGAGKKLEAKLSFSKKHMEKCYFVPICQRF